MSPLEGGNPRGCYLFLVFWFHHLTPFYQIPLVYTEFSVKGLLLDFCVLLYTCELPPVALKWPFRGPKGWIFPFFGV
jgi:hypothetical protein